MPHFLAFCLRISKLFRTFALEFRKGMGKAADLWFRIGSYARFLLRSRNTMGYGIHSPYLFYIARTIIPETAKYYCFEEVERVRRELLRDKTEIGVEDFGIGGMQKESSPSGNLMKRQVAEVAKVALKSQKEAQLLFRLVNLIKAETIVELGTSLGLTTAYLALPNKEAKVWTFEGSKELLKIAKQNWKRLGIENVEAVQGNLDETLEREAKNWRKVDFAFLDANHRKETTIRYFDVLATHAGEKSLFVVDDIRYSREMWEAWKEIEKREDVTARMDLGSMGLVFFDKHFPRQTFRIRL